MQEMWVRFLGQDGNPFQYSCLRNQMDRGVWHATAYEVAKSWTQGSNNLYIYKVKVKVKLLSHV